MDNNKKTKLMIIGFSVLVILVVGVTYAFFNYTRTGLENALSTSTIEFTSTDDTLLNIATDFPQDADLSNEELVAMNTNHSGVLSVSGHNTLANGVKYSIYVIHGDDITGKQRLDDSSIKFQLEPDFTSGSNGISVLTNNYSEPTNLVFDNEGKALISTGLVKNTTELTTVDYNFYMWLDASSMHVSSTMKRATLAEGNPSLADTTTGTATADRYLKNDGVLVSDVTLYPATSNEEGKIVYTTNEFSNGYYNIKFLVVAEEGKKTGTDKVLAAIETKQNAETNSCNPVWIDDMGTANDDTDDITYFSGTKTCVDMNYVWYSGKLWRITAIYPDGAMKLVTEDTLATIYWGNNVEYDGSWIYQWVNEDFYNTLVNPNSIIDSSTWNYSTDGNSTPVRPETIATQKTKVAPVGLLNAYEYYNSYRCINSAACTGSGYGTGYLNIGYNWWLITPYSTSSVRLVGHSGYFNSYSPSNNAYGVRPSINLKSGLEFTGDGSKSNPYKIVGDKEDAVNNTTLLSSRSVGEYVKFDNDLYRIVDTSGGITKLTRVDYLRDSGTVINKNFASTIYYGKSSNTQSDDYLDYYLNNTWYDSISSDYKSMLVDGTYYLGLYPNDTNYKATICKDANLNSVATANCTKYTSSDTDKTFTGKVGLPRVGEMFSSQLGTGYSTSSYIWLITPRGTLYVRVVLGTGYLDYNSTPSDANGVRPSINLKSGIKITGGTGMENDPFEISE